MTDVTIHAETPEPAETIYYSHSKLENQATCPARNFFGEMARQGRLEKEDLALPLVTGSAAHKEIEMRLKHGTPRGQALEEYLQENLWDKFPAKEIDREKALERIAHINFCLDRFEEVFYPSLMETLTDPEHQLEVKLQVPFRKGLLTGVIDVLLPWGEMSDWKTSSKPPNRDRLMRHTQAPMYYYLAAATGMPRPTRFNYVYLCGLNEKMIQAEYKSGPRQGETYWKKDPNNPTKDWKYTFHVLQDEDKVRRIFANYLMPRAKAFEQKIYYKVETDFNCNGCQYRTVCPNYDLPKQEDYIDLLSMECLAQKEPAA